MSESLSAWLETGFNIFYLIAVWLIVALMIRHQKRVAAEDRKVANLIKMSFILLAAGDTGHVGFRVIAHLLGNVNTVVNVFGASMSLVGLGTLTTAYTVTLFYMLYVFIWQYRYEKKANWLTSLLLVAGVIRLIFMALPANNWGSVISPQPMSLYRNIPLLIQGVGVVALCLYSGYKQHDRLFQWIAWMIVISFAFYTPVIIFAQKYPPIGMLMIPKTCAYLAVAIIAYRFLWVKKGAETGGK